MALGFPAPAVGADKLPVDPLSDVANMTAAYGRITQGQLGNPAYLPALIAESSALAVAQLVRQAASPTRSGR